MRLIYLIGPPGSGKSTLMGALTRDCYRVPLTDGGMPRDALFQHEEQVGVELGRQRGSFSGTDALPMNIHPTACKWIATSRDPLVFAEGQRLGTKRFFRTALDAGRTVDLIWLDPAPEVCEARRAARGSRQNPQWVKGAITRATNLAHAATAIGVNVHRIDHHGSADVTEAHAREALHLYGRLA